RTGGDLDGAGDVPKRLTFPAGGAGDADATEAQLVGTGTDGEAESPIVGDLDVRPGTRPHLEPRRGGAVEEHPPGDDTGLQVRDVDVRAVLRRGADVDPLLLARANRSDDPQAPPSGWNASQYIATVFADPRLEPRCERRAALGSGFWRQLD